MPSSIVRGATGQPGPSAYANGITSGIFNELNYVISDYIPDLVSKYGNESYMLVADILGASVVEKSMTSTQTFSHFEKGRPYGSGIVNANVAQGAAGAAVSVTLKSPQSYVDGAAGTRSPFMLNQTIKVRSNGLKFKVTNVTRTTGAFVIELTPLGNYTVHSSNLTSIVAGEGLETYGNQLAGESSDSQGTQSTPKYRIDNTATVIRASTKSSDLVHMNKTQINFGGGNYYEPALAIRTMNEQMLMAVEDAVLEGVPYSNISGTVGTVGVIPDVIARGSEIDYVARLFAVGDFQNLTNVLDANGGPREYHFLQDLQQRQDINNLLFGIYRNGAISYGSVGFGQEASATYGFKSFSTDTFDFHFHRYKGFTPQAVYGYMPTQGDYRANYGLAVPQGMTQDAGTNSTKGYMQWVYQKNPDIPTTQGIYSWSLGYTQDTKTTEASNKYEQIVYVGSRTVAAEQFAQLKGLVS